MATMRRRHPLQSSLRLRRLRRENIVFPSKSPKCEPVYLTFFHPFYRGYMEMAELSTGGFGSSDISTATLIEGVASANSSSVFVYDLAEHIGFGLKTAEWQNACKGRTTNVVRLQTRAGAGLSLVGRLSDEGTSKEVQRDSVLTAYTTPSGLAIMASSFAYLSEPSATSRLVLQVPNITPVGSKLEFSPSLAALTPIINTLPESFAVILSASPQESIDLATLAYKISSSHVIHIFDYYSAGREVGNAIVSNRVSHTGQAVSVRDALQDAGYSFFEYTGDEYASDVLVTLNGPLAVAAKALAQKVPGFGVVAVRVLKPWDDADFLAALPASVRRIHVIDEVPTEGSQGNLYMDVFSACLSASGSKPSVKAVRLVPARTQEYIKSPSTFAAFVSGLVPEPPQQLPTVDSTNAKSILFFGSPKSALTSLPQQIVETFVGNPAIALRSLTEYDVFSKPGGISASRIILGPKTESSEYIPLHVLLPLGGTKDEPGKADFLVVLDQSILKSHAIVNYLKRGSILLLFSTWTAPEVQSNIPVDVLDYIRENNIQLYTVDTKGSTSDGNSSLQTAVAHLVFLRFYLGAPATELSLRKLAHTIYGPELGGVNVDKLNAKAWAELKKIEVSDLKEQPAEETHVELKDFEFNATSPELSESQTSLPGAHLSSWHDAARHLIFPDAFVPNVEQPLNEEYPQNPALRPELPERTFLVTCSVNRRLTPLDYDRNVFHLEFDTSGTGLKYDIGEALGVHGWNDTDEVLEFCSWYGVDPDRLITIPIPNGEGKVHTRTVFQALQQQIDLFGKPPKSFYFDLADHATRKEDKLSLQFIGSPEGSATFKKLSEKDTVTFAEVLKKYASARPSIELLCEMVGDIKPRHYSIASAQSVVGDRVDLLVVTVEWATPSGSPRYGQCTRYLAGLKVGQKVTVSIKPSVMKLPPNDMQPLILAGLGTGAAPFRAFLQHRAWLSDKGVPVGPLYYYFGSRYRSKEYLYGEEIEAFMLDRTITKAGLAFSRDGRKKVYIQHKMIEDAEQLVTMLHRDKGVFYLCGPTWPVPDVYETLVGALVKHIGLGTEEAADYLEGLKEEERYVLEVY